MPGTTPHDSKSVLCLIVDGLHIGYLGAYGNAWLPTPALDRLASESFLFDRALVNSTQLKDQYNAIWHGDWRAALDCPAGTTSMLAQLTSVGVQTMLVTDDDSVYQGASDSFADSTLVDIAPATRSAGDLESTRIATFFQKLSSLIADAPQNGLIWAHTRGLTLEWDAPYELRERYADADDPPPPPTVVPPEFVIDEDTDPDVLLGWRQAYAGQIEVLDTCVGALVEQLDDLFDREATALCLLSSRGYPLGEHGVVGISRAGLFAESTSIPWMMRLPESIGGADRSDALVEPSDLMPTLLDLLGAKDGRERESDAVSLLPLVRGDVTSTGDRLFVSGRTPDQWAMATPSWYLTRDISATGDASQHLFARPDDRWDQNDVAALCADVVADMNAYAEEMRKLGRARDWRPLDASLCTPHT